MTGSSTADEHADGRIPTPSRFDRPENVFTHADLVLALDRLRRAAALNGRARISYARLAGRVHIPASTLHTYFSGSVVPPADALDRIVRALGVDAPQAGPWAAALERVNDTSFAGANAIGPSSTSILRRHHDRVHEQMSGPLQRAVDNSRRLLVSSVMTVDADRVIRTLDSRIVTQALGPGVDRDSLQLLTSLETDLDTIELCRTANCSVGSVRTLQAPPVRLVELEFDHELLPGEMYSYEYSVAYTGILEELLEMRRRRPGANPFENAGAATRVFPFGGTYFSLDVQFDPAALPQRVIQIQRPSHGDLDHEITVREVPISSWNRASMLVERSRPGVVGLRWFF